MAEKVLLWDFDGTLAYREGRWSGTLMEILQTEEPGLAVDREQIHLQIRYGFPWNLPEEPHTEIRDGDEWWQRLLPLFRNTFVAVGVAEPRAAELATRVRDRYCDPQRWHLFADTVPVLEALAASGWTHVVLSNHVPELASLVSMLGIRSFFRAVHNSAWTGYEKPHPEAFRIVLRDLAPGAEVWMIGDNPVADVAGAQAVGIPAILVRSTAEDVPRQCPDLYGVGNYLSPSGSVH